MNGISNKRSAIIAVGALAAAIAIGGCDAGADSVLGASLVNNCPNSTARLTRACSRCPISCATWIPSDPSVLRYQSDRAGGRLWALTADGVEVYDATSRRKLAQVTLPGWMWVGEQYACPPDLAIGPGGEAVISSNVVSTLWRIDPVTLAASKHDLAIVEDTGRDIGFTALAYSAQQGAYFAVSAAQGSLWRIDPLLRRAQSVPLSAPLPKACGLAIPPRERNQWAGRGVGFCVRGEQGDWTISLAPDQRSGYVRAGQCLI